jgi:glycogen operon protein
MHVDGFRFDLASILTRDEKGAPQANPPVLWDIESSPVLAGNKLFAEAWDAAGLYQVGSFVGDSWKEWNGRFRDDARDFFRGAEGATARFADRLIGSPEIFGHEDREPEQSVNFVTCHDGFTLNDLSLQRETQRDERRGEPRRRERQPELELRRRGAERRSRDRGAAETAGEELLDRDPALHRHAHGPDGRRGVADPKGQ